MFTEKPNMTVLEPDFPVTINYDLTFREMIEAGNYDSVCSFFGEFYMKKGKNFKKVLKLIHFNRPMRVYEALDEIKSINSRPVITEELLSFGATYPKEQLKYPILGLGSVRSQRFGPSLSPRLGSYLARSGYVFVPRRDLDSSRADAYDGIVTRNRILIVKSKSSDFKKN